jgi:hypothetical protein
VAEDPLESFEVAPALAEETVREAVPELVRGELPDTGPLADAPHHPHECLVACRFFRILAPPATLVLRHPLLDLDGEDVILAGRLERDPIRP